MRDWQQLLDKKKWDRLDDFWRHGASQEVCAEILAALRRVVPVVERTNGTERKLEHALPHEVPADLAGAAKILCMGELEATALGIRFSPTYLTQWNELLPQVRRACAELAALPEVTDGTADMSRAGHAKEASELLAFIPAILEAMLYSGEADEEEPDELGPQLQEHVATAAIYAFEAGRHFQAALGKEHESAALRTYENIARNRKSGLLGGQAAKKQERYEVLNKLAKDNLLKFQFVSDAQAKRAARSLAASHDRGADAPLFQINNKPMSDAWFDDWLSAFRAAMSQATGK